MEEYYTEDQIQEIVGKAHCYLSIIGLKIIDDFTIKGSSYHEDSFYSTFDLLITIENRQAFDITNETFQQLVALLESKTYSTNGCCSPDTDYIFIYGSVQTFKILPLSFLQLTDTPKTYDGSAGLFVRVKSDESGLEFFNFINDFNPDGILNGLGMSIAGSNVLIAAGRWVLSNTTYFTSGTTTLAIDAQDATLSRYDAVYAATDGLHIISGTLSATPVYPTIPNGTLLVGTVFITPTTVTTTPVIGSYVTTNTNQTGLSGSKTWTGKQTYAVAPTFQNVLTGSIVSLLGIDSSGNLLSQAISTFVDTTTFNQKILVNKISTATFNFTDGTWTPTINTFPYTSISKFGVTANGATGVAISLQANGNYLAYQQSGFTGALYWDTLAANQNIRLPNESGTIALLSDFPSLAGYVPYIGADSNVNLGNNQLLLTGSSAAITLNSDVNNIGVKGVSAPNIYTAMTKQSFEVHNSTGGTGSTDMYTDLKLNRLGFNNISASFAQYLVPTSATLTGNITNTLPSISGTLAVDSNIVHLTGAETITGAKTFSSNIILNSGGTQVATLNNSSITFTGGSGSASNVIYNANGIYDNASGTPFPYLYYDGSTSLSAGSGGYIDFYDQHITKLVHFGSPEDDLYNWFKYPIKIGGTEGNSTLAGGTLEVEGKIVATGAPVNPNDVVRLSDITGTGGTGYVPYSAANSTLDLNTQLLKSNIHTITNPTGQPLTVYKSGIFPTQGVVVGAQGQFEANVSYNMDYNSTGKVGVHQAFDTTLGAIWYAAGPNYWRMQYAPANVLQTGVGSITFTGGSGYTDGTYDLATTGGTGTLEHLQLVISGGIVTSCVSSHIGNGYTIGDVLSVFGIGAGTGFSATVTSLYTDIWNSTGKNIFIQGDIVTGTVQVGTTGNYIPVAGATMNVSRSTTNSYASIAGTTDGRGIIINGDPRPLTAANVYLNHDNTGSVFIAGGNGNVTFGTNGVPSSGFGVFNTTTASSGAAFGMRLRPTVVASANSDTLYGAYFDAIYTQGSFTTVANVAARFNSAPIQFQTISTPTNLLEGMFYHTGSVLAFYTGSTLYRAVLQTNVTASSNQGLVSNSTGQFVPTTSTGTGAPVLAISPTFTGAPLSTTAAFNTNTTQIATTAFVKGLNYLKTIFVPTTGNTVTLVAHNYNIINPAGTLAALTFVMPTSPVDGDILFVKFIQAVTTITWPAAVKGAVTTVAAASEVILIYDSSSTNWY